MSESSLESSGMNLKLNVELLNDTNYERWARDMMILIAGKGLTFIVDGTERYPSATGGSAGDASTSSTTSASTTFTKEQLKWKSRDVMAKALLASHMEPHFRRKYWSAESARKMWSAVKKDQKETGAEHFHRINDDIQSLKVADFPTVIAFNEKFKSLLCDLALCDNEGKGMSDMEATYIILRALPMDDEAWRTFRHIHCNANRPQQLMDEMVKQESRLKSERKSGLAPSGGEVMYSQARNVSGNDKPRNGNNGRGNNFRDRARRDMTIICHNCGKKGHKKKECWSKAGIASSDSGSGGQRGRSWNTSRRVDTRNGTGNGNQSASAIWSFNGNTERDTINSTSQQRLDDAWWIDSGCSNHVSGIRSYFTDYRSYAPGERTVNVADKRNLVCQGIGTIEVIVCLPHRKSQKVAIENVLHVKDCRNLLSLGQLMERGLEVKIEPRMGCHLYKDGVLMGTARMQNRLFLLDTLSNDSQKERSGGEENIFFEAETESKQKRWNEKVWHWCLGHISYDSIRSMKEVVVGMRVEKNSGKERKVKCEDCVRGSLSHKSFLNSQHTATKILERVNSDVCGPVETVSLRK